MWRFITWNLDWHRRRPESVPRWSLLQSHDALVIALQEVSGPVAKTLQEAHQGPSLFSQELYPPADWSWMGCALLLHPDSRVLDSGVLTALPKPQRSLWADVELPGRDPITVVSWHTPNAAGDGRDTKMAAYAAMSDWLAEAKHPVVLGADLNTWRDPVDLVPADPEDEFFEEHAFVGLDPPHGLVDAYRSVLESSGQLDQLRRDRPGGPLAVSHVLSSGAEHRMDRIFASPGLRVIAADYAYEEASRAAATTPCTGWTSTEPRRTSWLESSWARVGD